jgi:hypothetical protein
MHIDHPQVIVTTGTSPDHLIPTTLIHHRDFPEIWAQGGSPREAATYLVNQLGRALESAGNLRGRRPLEAALSEVYSYLRTLGVDMRTPPTPHLLFSADRRCLRRH